MGIQGLLQFLKNSDENVSAIKPTHLSKFRGKKAAIDAYSWLHKGVFCCAGDLFLNKPTTKYVDYCLKNIKLLQDHSITPVLVFDGGRMPFKVVEKNRRETRQKAKKQADDLIAAGRMNEAYMQMVQSINITHEMASNLMKAARKIGIESVVAPYEADAQLVYLEKQGLVDFIISEDSDLIVFGAQKVFLKMAPSGHGDLFDADFLELCLQANKRLKGSFSPQKLLFAAILSGCDYLKNLPGVGLIKAWKFMTMTENTNIRQFLKKVPSYLKLNSVVVDEEYIEGFVNAVLAFEYQIVFDTRQKRRVPLCALKDDVSKDDYNNFLNRFTSVELDHLQLALGNIDNKKQHFDDYHPHMLSYLYYGVEQVKTKVTPESPVIGFKTDGVYKRKSSRQSGKSRRSSSGDLKQSDCQEDEDMVDYYKNMSPQLNVKTKEVEEVKCVEPPRKRIKCKFLKFKSNDDDTGKNEEVQSRFFNTKINSDDTHVDADDKTQVLTQNGHDIPKENIVLSQKNDSDRNNDSSDMKQVFKDCGVDIDSEASNDSHDLFKTNRDLELVKKTPEKKDVSDNVDEIICLSDIKYEMPESPIITSQIDKIKPRLKEIQNVQKLGKVKRKVMPKNQPTLLGFFKKL